MVYVQLYGDPKPIAVSFHGPLPIKSLTEPPHGSTSLGVFSVDGVEGVLSTDLFALPFDSVFLKESDAEENRKELDKQ